MSSEVEVEFSLELPVEATQARVDAAGNPWKVSGRLFRLAKDKLTELVKLPPRDVVIKEAGAAFDKYVAPIDISFVPNIIEPMVDAAMRDVFVDSVGKLYDAIAKSKA